MNRFLSFILIQCLLFPAFAQEAIKHWEEIISSTRRSNLNLFQKEEIAKGALDFFRNEFEKEMGDVRGSTLYEKVLTNPTIVSSLTNNQKFKNLFTEFSQLINQLIIEKKLKDCKSYLDLVDPVRLGAANFSPCSEKSYSHNYLVLKNTTSGSVVTHSSSIPNFVYTDNVADLLAVSSTLDLKVSMPGNKPFVASGIEIKNANGQADQQQLVEIYNKMQLREEAYKRSLLNALRNIISIDLKYGDKIFTAEEINSKVLNNLAQYCKYCSENVKNSLNLKLRAILKQDLSSGKISHQPSYQVVSNICGKLRKENYPFYETYNTKEYMPVSMALGKGAAQSNVYQDRRLKALSHVIQDGDNGLLLLTQSLTNLDDKIPERVKLKCNGAEEDKKLIVEAGKEAKEKAGEYITKLNEEMTLTSQVEEIDDDLAWILKTNPTSFGQALLDDPQIAEVTCSLITRLNAENEREKMNDQMVLWGSVVVGGALTATGALSPLGGTIMLIGLQVTAGIGNGAYNALEARESYEQFELFEAATFATGNSNNQADIAQDEFAKYQGYKTSAIIGLGLSSTDIAAMTKGALKAGKTLAQINAYYDKALKAKDVKLLAQMADDAPLLAVKQHLGGMRDHLTSVDVLGTAQFRPNGKIIVLENMPSKKIANFTSNRLDGVVVEGIESTRAIRLEPLPLDKNMGNQIESIILKTTDGTSLGKISCVKKVNECLKGVNGQEIYDIPIDQNYLVVIKQRNGQEVIMNTSLVNSSNDLPTGFRFSLEQKNYVDSGFYGGHTQDSFNQYLSMYKDRVNVVEDKTVELSFKVSGSDKEFKVKQIYTSIDGVMAKNPKTIFVGGENDLILLEKALAPRLIGQFETDKMIIEKVTSTQRTNVALFIPFRDGRARTLMLGQLNN